MGIKNFGQFLKQAAPSAKKEYPLSNFSGYRIAIDGHNYMYKYMATAQKIVVYETDVAIAEVDHEKVRSIWLENMVSFIINFITAGVTPIFVIDGPPLKAKETNALKKRREQYRIQDQKLAKVNAEIERIGPLMVGNDLLRAKKNLLKNRCSPSSEDIAALLEVYRALGVPVIRAKNDGEKLASSLCIEGKAVAVLSADTDNLVFGCPILITELKGDKAVVIQLADVLQESGLTFAEFSDACIMFGCDYNDNIKGIGVKRALVNIRQYHSLDAISSYLKTDCLDYQNCRCIFQYHPSEELLFEGQVVVLDMDRLVYQVPPSQILKNRELTSAFNNLRWHISRLPHPTTVASSAITA